MMELMRDVSTKIERVIIPCPFKIFPGTIRVGQGQVAVSHAKLQICKVRVNAGCFLINGKRVTVQTSVFQLNTLLVYLIPGGFPVFFEIGRMLRRKRGTVLQINGHRAQDDWYASLVGRPQDVLQIARKILVGPQAGGIVITQTIIRKHLHAPPFLGSC